MPSNKRMHIEVLVFGWMFCIINVMGSSQVMPPLDIAPETSTPPGTNAPETSVPPVTNAPETSVPPVTNAPETSAPPVTNAAETSVPPVTNAPETSVQPVTNAPEASVLPVTSVWYNGVEFREGVRVIAPDVETLDVVGLSMCFRRCERYGTHCDRVSFNTNTLQCTVGLGPSSLTSASSDFITSISTVTSVTDRCRTSSHSSNQTSEVGDPCSSISCSGGERCVVIRRKEGLCVPPDPIGIPTVDDYVPLYSEVFAQYDPGSEVYAYPDPGSEVLAQSDPGSEDDPAVDY